MHNLGELITCLCIVGSAILAVMIVLIILLILA